LVGAIKASNTALIFTNQMRQKIGIMFGNPGDHAGRPGAEVLRQRATGYPAHRGHQAGGNTVGNRTRVTVKKNKVAAPFRQAEFDIMYNKGISKSGDLLDLGTNMNIIEKRGAFYSYEDLRLGQGRENAKEFLEKDPVLIQRIEMAIRTAASMVPLQVVEASDEEDADDETVE
jgi:recombination protein RecA